MIRENLSAETEASRILAGLDTGIQDQLLAQLVYNRIGSQGGFIPDAAWPIVQQAFRLPYAEVLLVREYHNKLEGALVERHDEYWNGWHIPGGRISNPNLNFEEACQAVARGELGIGIRLLYPDPVYTYLWTDHPYGHPISLVGVAVTDDVLEPDKARFFSEPPENMVPHHAQFFQRAFEFLTLHPNLLPAL